MDSDDDVDDAFLSEIDKLVAHHQSQAAPRALRGSQPSSPYQAAAGAALRQPPANHLPPAALFQAHPPLQQINGVGQSLPAAGLGHKPAAAAGGALARPPVPQPRPGSAGPGPHAWQPGAQQPHWGHHSSGGGGGGGGAHAHDVQGRLAHLESELGRTASQNKLLSATLQQRDRELSALRQQKAALERAAAQHAQQAGGGAPMHRALSLAELQKQLESAQRQLAFKETEMADLRRQHADRTERLRQAEASAGELREQLKQAGRQAAAPAASAAAGAASEPSGGGGGSGAQPADQQRDGRPSVGQASAQRSGSHVRPPSAAQTGTPAEAAQVAVAATAAVAPLIDPGVLAAAAALTGGASLPSRLMAACPASMALLVGGAAQSGVLEGGGPAAPSTALLLRSRLAAVAAQAPDRDSLAFVASFTQRVQQVASGMLPAAALLDGIASLAAASLAQLHGCGVGGSTPPASGLPAQRVRLIAAGLEAAQHLLELDGGCRAAALAPFPPAGAPAAVLESLPSQPRGSLSSRVRFAGGSGPSAAAAGGPPPLQPPGGPATLLGTCLLVRQHAAAFAGLPAGGSAGVLLPVALGAALRLGQRHDDVAAGALGTLCALAGALRGEGARAPLAPLFTSGALELFMSSPALRLPALRLLHLLLEDSQLAALFEASLAAAAAARGEPGPPSADAGAGQEEGAGGSSSPAREAGGVAGGGGGAAQQRAAEAEPGPWLGAAVIAERLLDSFVLGGPEHASGPASGGQPPGASAGSSAQPGAAQPAGGPAPPSAARAAHAAAAAPRAAMELVAMLRERRQLGILAALLADDACGAPGCMLAQRLVQLLESASALPGEEGGMMMLCPAQWPASGGGGGGGALVHQQAAWQQRLRVVQEALTLLRGLLVDDSTANSAMDDLVSLPAAARLAVTTLSRLSRLEAPPAPPPGAAPPPEPLPLAPWARAIGSSTDDASIAEAGGGAGRGPDGRPRCAVEDVVYMAKSCRRRALFRLQQSSMEQG